MTRGGRSLGAVPASVEEVSRTGLRLTLFPGSATPSVFQANVPFWTGCGFVSGADDSGNGLADLETSFELDVDGKPVLLETDVQMENGRPVAKVSIAHFRSGLRAGWHQFEGRWLDSGAVVLASGAWIEFVER